MAVMDEFREERENLKNASFQKKWQYFWDYYKIHTFVVLFVILIAGVTIYQSVTAPNYDFNVSYAGAYNLVDENAELLRQKMSEFVTDSDGDGEDGVAFNRISFMEGNEDPQVEYASITRLQLEVTDKNSILFIFDETKAPYYIGVSEMEGVFLESGEWLEGEIGEEELYISNGKAYTVSLKGSKILEECGINSDNLYVAVRNYAEEPDDELKEKIADAKNIANAIVK